MGGHAPVSPRQLAASLGQMLGRHIEPILVPLDQVVLTFTGLGFSESAASLMREMYEGLGSGRVGYEDPAAPHVRGTLTPVERPWPDPGPGVGAVEMRSPLGACPRSGREGPCGRGPAGTTMGVHVK